MLGPGAVTASLPPFSSETCSTAASWLPLWRLSQRHLQEKQRTGFGKHVAESEAPNVLGELVYNVSLKSAKAEHADTMMP